MAYTMSLVLKKAYDVPRTQALPLLRRLSPKSTSVASPFGQPSRGLQHSRPRTRHVVVPLACVSRHRPSSEQRRSYVTKPPPGSSGGFPGLSFGSQHQKGEALKQFVRSHLLYIWFDELISSEYRFN